MRPAAHNPPGAGRASTPGAEACTECVGSGAPSKTVQREGKGQWDTRQSSSHKTSQLCRLGRTSLIKWTCFYFYKLDCYVDSLFSTLFRLRSPHNKQQIQVAYSIQCLPHKTPAHPAGMVSDCRPQGPGAMGPLNMLLGTQGGQPAVQHAQGARQAFNADIRPRGSLPYHAFCSEGPREPCLVRHIRPAAVSSYGFPSEPLCA